MLIMVLLGCLVENLVTKSLAKELYGVRLLNYAINTLIRKLALQQSNN